MKHTKEVKALKRAHKEYFSLRKRVILEATQSVSNAGCYTYPLPTGCIFYLKGRVYFLSAKTKQTYKIHYCK